MSIKLVFLYSELMPYVITIMKALHKEHGAEIHCICWDEKKMTPFTPVNTNGVTFYKRSQFDTKGIKEFISHHNPAAIFVSGRMDRGYMQAVSFFKSKGIPIVSACDNQWTGSLKNWLSAVMTWFVYKRYFTYFWVPGRRQYEFARRVGYANNNILSYWLCADLDVFTNAYREKTNTRKIFPKTIVFAGRFATEKGLDILVSAFKRFKTEVKSEWKLILVGTGPVSIAEDEDIHVQGFMSTEQLAQNSINWGVFCLPSLFEPWGVVLHEFTAAGMPIISSDAVGSADTFVIDGYNGFVSQAGSAASLYRAFVKLSKLNDEELWTMAARSIEMSRAITPAKSASAFMSIFNEAPEV